MISPRHDRATQVRMKFNFRQGVDPLERPTASHERECRNGMGRWRRPMEPLDEEPPDLEDVMKRVSNLESFILNLEADIQQRLCDLDSTVARLGQSFPCP